MSNTDFAPRPFLQFIAERDVFGTFGTHQNACPLAASFLWRHQNSVVSSYDFQVLGFRLRMPLRPSQVAVPLVVGASALGGES